MLNLLWNQVAVEASEVIARRMWLVPFWWMTDPQRARRETERMFSEKHDALTETQLLLMQAPAQYWSDVWQSLLGGRIDGSHANAVHAAGERIGIPTSSRVTANRRRLADSTPF